MLLAAGVKGYWVSKDWPMDTLLRFASVFFAVPLMTIAVIGSAIAAYKIPDDCLGDWDYCNSLWIRHFDKFGLEFLDTLRFEEDNGAIDSRDANSRCQQGRDIIATRGFQHVRIVECRGRTYTYLGRRYGDTFRIFVSSRSGRITNINPL
jgi:hypothetical protein